MRKAWLWGLPVLVVLFLGCSTLIKSPAEQAAVESIVTRFHEAYNAEEFGPIYSEADPEFQKITSAKEYIEFMAAVRKKLGRETAAIPKGWHAVQSGGVTRISASYQTTFEKGGALETFTVRLHHGKSTLLGYNITSNALIKG